MFEQLREWVDGVAEFVLIRFDQAIPDPPGMELCDAVGAGLSEAGVLALLVPWGALGVCLAMFLGVQALALQMRLLRIKASYATGGGGAA